MADPTPVSAPVVVHTNIYEALAAFQGENPEVVKTKSFGKPGDSMHFKYAELDDFLKVVRPLTSKHGLAITWEGDESSEKGMRCALYHSTYQRDSKVIDSEEEHQNPDGIRTTKVTKYKTVEDGVIRSMPIKVTREGKMQTVGSDSTYARRYTLSEVLGVASDEDTDAELDKASGQNAQGAMYARAKKGIEDAQTSADTEKAVKVLKADLALLEKGKAPSLGLKKEQYTELVELAQKKIGSLDSAQAPAPEEGAA